MTAFAYMEQWQLEKPQQLFRNINRINGKGSCDW